MSRSTTGDSILTVNGANFPNKKIFVTGIHISTSQDATSDNIVMLVQATIEGDSVVIWRRGKLTTTEENFDTYLSFTKPIQLDKDTNMTWTAQFTVGALVANVDVHGFVIDD